LPSIVPPPRHAANVVSVAGAVDLPGSLARRRRLPKKLYSGRDSVDEPVKPVRLRKSLRVDKRGPVAVLGRRKAVVVSTCKTGVTFQADELYIRETRGDAIR
jgi:hypothetical protein